MNDARRTNPIRIKLAANGQGLISIGGRKMEQYTQSIQLFSRAGDVPRVLLEVAAGEGLEAELDALVDVVIRNPKTEIDEAHERTLP